MEQSFSLVDRLGRQQGPPSNVATLRNLVLAAVNLETPADKARLIEEARRIWASAFGALRGPRRVQRLPTRQVLMQHRVAKGQSLSAVIRLRRAGVETAPAAANTRAHERARELWGPCQAAELKRQKTLQHDRLLDAKLDGTAVASTLAPDADALSARDAANKRHRQEYLRKQEKALQPPRLLTLPPGSNIYFAAGTWEPWPPVPPLTGLRWHRFQRTSTSCAVAATARSTS